MDSEPDGAGNILYVNFVYRCPSTKKCGRKIRVKFLDNHVVQAVPLLTEEGKPDGFSMSYVEGEGIRYLSEEDPHAVEEFAVVKQLTSQYIGWLYGSKVFSGVDSY